MKEGRLTHPSFGLISWNRTFSNGKKDLFGSSIEHSNSIFLKISQGEVIRNLNKDYYHPSKPFIEIELSPNQFSDFITSPNSGPGIPCTIRYTEKDGYVEGQEISHKRKQFENEFSQELKGIASNFEKLENYVTSLTTSSKVKKELQSKIFEVKRIIDDNIPFIQKSFNEQLDNTITEAKSSVESFVEQKIRQTGLEALKDSINLIKE